MNAQAILEVRLAIVGCGYIPIPIIGKRPPFDRWQKVTNVTRLILEGWSQNFPGASNTGILTRVTPTIDLDLLQGPAACAAEEFIRARFSSRGRILTRVGRAPKRAIPFRALQPFKKLTSNFAVATGAEAEKIEFLGDGQQFVAHGIHPDTQTAYTWSGGDPTTIAYTDLPEITAEEAQRLQSDLVALLCRDFGYTAAKGRMRNGTVPPAAGSGDWQELVDNILAGQDLHDSTRDLAAKMARSGMQGGAIVNFLRGLMSSSTAPRDARWQSRYEDLPRAVDTIEAKIEGERQAAATASMPPPPPPLSPPPPLGAGPTPTPGAAPRPDALEATIEVFERWLILPRRIPVYAMLGAVAANLLPGEPVWLGIVAPPSNAKTELLNSITGLPFVVSASTLTLPGLLSGTPKRQQTQGAHGGLLRQVSNPGVLCLKDFTSVLSMRPDSKAEVFAALREIYDGQWIRRLGTDGGKVLEWRGKLGLVYGVTNVIDTMHSVADALGNRYLLMRTESGEGQLRRALQHAGGKTTTMRRELVEAVNTLFFAPSPQPIPRSLSEEEITHLERITNLVVHLRGAVERDRYRRELDAIYGAEGTGRLGLSLERLLAGLDVLGLDREKAVEVATAVALDSTPPLRKRIYWLLCEPIDPSRPNPLGVVAGPAWETADVAARVGLPTTTTRRTLEDLACYGLAYREPGGSGMADKWQGVILF
jgi:hypothetical protein